MKIGVISEKGHLLGQAYRMANKGHDVVFQCQDAEVGRGLVQKGKVVYKNHDFILTDTNSIDVDALRKMGYPVFGGGKLDKALGSDSFVSLMVNAIAITKTDLKGAINLYVGGLFNGEGFTFMFSYVPYRTFMDGVRGKQVATMGCVLWPYYYPNNLLREVLFPLKPVLSRFDFHGMFTVQVDVTELDISIKDASITTRADILDAIGEILKIDPARMFHMIAKGESTTIPTANQYSLCVYVTMPPFPESMLSPMTKIKLPAEGMNHIWPKEMAYKQETNEYWGKNIVLSVTAQDTFMRRAVKRVQRTISNLDIPEAGYRTDIGKGVVADILKLDEWGWI